MKNFKKKLHDEQSKKHHDFHGKDESEVMTADLKQKAAKNKPVEHFGKKLYPERKDR